MAAGDSLTSSSQTTGDRTEIRDVSVPVNPGLLRSHFLFRMGKKLRFLPRIVLTLNRSPILSQKTLFTPIFQTNLFNVNILSDLFPLKKKYFYCRTSEHISGI